MTGDCTLFDVPHFLRILIVSRVGGVEIVLGDKTDETYCAHDRLQCYALSA